MSRWTHIRGGFELKTSPYRLKNPKQPGGLGSKNVIIPKPDEQVEIRYPRACCSDDNLKLTFTMYIFSLPIAKPVIDKAFKLLPHGEDWSYSISQSIYNGSCSSGQFEFPCEEKIFYKKVQEMFKGDYIDESHVDVDFIECIDEIIIGVREDIRYYSGEEMLQALEKFFIYLRQNEVDVEDGYLEWEDEYESDYIYCWRSSRVTDDVETLWSFYKLDRQTNRILWYKQYKKPVKISKDGEEFIDYESKDLVIEESEK